MEYLYAKILLFAILVVILVVINVMFRRRIDKICSSADPKEKTKNDNQTP